MGAGHAKKTNHVITGLGKPCDTSRTSGERRETREWVNHDYVNIKVCLSSPGWQCSEYCQVSVCQKGNAFRLHGERGQWKFHVWKPPRSCPIIHQSLWLVLIWIFFYNKTVTGSIVLSWVLWGILTNYWTWGSSGDPQIYNKLIRNEGILGILKDVTGV